MPERFLEGRTALVTGSVQCIGFEIGKALASAGARLAVYGLAMPKQADAAVRAMRDAGVPDVRFFDADMRLPAVIDAMMNSVAAWGGTDGVGSRDSGGITVNCICPDWTENRNYRTADFGVGGPGQRKPRCSDFQSSGGETAQPADVAARGDRRDGSAAGSPDVP
jgi:NAD(P)-dependent dehydrogenase (short-subunit alcohol dehydrogenase family)